MYHRVGIFVFFDKDGIADKYVDYLLKNLKNICQEIYLIANGKIRKNDLNRLEQYTTGVFIRENIGYDAGAYKDAFLQFIPHDDLIRYDEIVLVNDTAFGPIYPFEDFWDSVKEEGIDFWGLTRHPKILLSDGKEINSHIQSFFLVLGKRILESPYFLDFWKELEESVDYQSIVDAFELRFTTFFEKHGFKGKALMDELALPCEGNPYILHSYELIKAKKLPFLKRKCLGFEREGFENALDALEYIKTNFQYDLDLVWDNVIRLSKYGRFESIFNYYKLEEFYIKYKRIFIYGAGKYGKRMQKYFQIRQWRFEGFLVSDNADEQENCSNYSDKKFEKTDGIILALGVSSMKEVLETIGRELDMEQIFIPQYT